MRDKNAQVNDLLRIVLENDWMVRSVNLFVCVINGKYGVKFLDYMFQAGFYDLGVRDWERKIR